MPPHRERRLVLRPGRAIGTPDDREQIVTPWIGRRRSLVTAVLIAGAVSAWVWSGERMETSPPPPGQGAPAAERLREFSVRVAVLHGEPASRAIILNGRTEPARAVTMRAELDGRVVAIGAERGARVARGDEVVRLDPRDLEARRRQARAEIRLREMEFDAATKLSARDFQTERALAAAESSLEAARATLARIEVDLANTRLRAPFDGRLDQRMVEIGDYVNDGNAVGRIIQEDPILVVGHVTQQHRHGVRLGDTGATRLITGETVSGRVRYVAAESDETTRTFRVELEVPNPGGALLSGVSAEIRISTRATPAHLVSPALLTLDAHGRLGIKGVEDGGVVTFHPVEVVRADDVGIWVSGLPDPARVITVGHGFVHPGQRVKAVPASPNEGGSG